MANGYLGKISAIVSANTADFDGKLSKSAKEVSSFARSVQSNLTSASRQAARSLEGIYTPLQKFERSLQAAATMKLSFKGFPGMIKDLDSLQSRLNSALSKRQVDIVLKTTGMSSVSALRDAISGLKSKDIELIARVGGVDKLKELGGKIKADVEIDAARKKLADLTADAEAAKAKVASIGSVPVAVKVNAEGVDSLKAKLEEARGAAGKLMGGEFMGQKSLTKAISGVSGELVKVEAELARAVAAQKTLESMKSGPRSKPEELSKANDRVASLTGQRDERARNLAELEKYRDTIKTVMRDIKQAEAGGGATAGGGDIAAAKKEEAAAIRAVSRAAKELQTQITAKYGVDIDLSDLDQLISRGGKASDVLERLPALMDELGRSDLEAASNKMRQLVSVSEELQDPMKAAQATLTGLAKEVQAGFLPALVQSQSEIESLNALIEDGIAPTAAIKKNFDQVKATVDATVASVRQLAEVSDKAGRLKTGRELVFAQPALSESLDRGAAVGNKAAGLPASAISSSPRLVESLVAVNQLTREAEAAFAKLQMKANVGLPTGSSQRSLDLLVAKLNEAISTTENLANAQAEAKSRAAAAADSEIANFIRVQQAAKTAEQERIAQAQKVADSEIANLQRVQQAAKAAEIERQAQSQKVADSEIANLQRVQQAAKAAEIERQAQAQKVADSEIANLQRVQQAAKAAEIERQAQSQKTVDAEIAVLQRRSQAEKSAEQERFAQAQKVADSEIANLQRVQQASKAAELERQAQAQRSADAEIAVLQRVQQAAKAAEIERQAQAQKVADSEIANLQRVQQAAKAAETERQAQAQKAVDAELAVLQRRSQADKAAELERQAQAQRTADAEIANLQRVQQAAKAAELERQARAQKTADDEIESLIRREQAAKAAATGGEGGGGLGLDIEAPARQLGVLLNSITSLKSVIDTLPEPLRARFVPAIREAEAEFIRLKSAAIPIAGEIEAARQRLIHLTQDATRAAQAMNFSQSFGGEGMTGVNLGLDQRALQGYNAQLQVLQGYMAQIPAAAAGPAVAAFNQLRNAIAQAFDDGTINTAETRRELAALLQATTQTTAALAGVSAGRIGRDMQRAGDIGRQGFDRFALAANQAGYAIDDFLSSTGGLEFKLRAISNNITQLAFILGGTTGLFIGLGAVIAGQVAIGIIKWINNGRTAEDQTKALNEALARQKNLVEELAEAFRSLGDSATRGIFSEQAQQAREFAREVDNILKKQRELGLQRVVGNDPAIQRERAEQTKLRREIEKEENPAVRVGKQQQLRASEEREQRRTQLLGVQPPPSAAEIRREVRLRAPVPFRNAAEGIPEGTDVASRVAQADAIRPAVDRLKEIVSEGNSSFDFGRFEIASRQLESLGNLLDRLDRAIGDAVAQAATDVAKASRGPAEQIRQAQEEVAKAIELGLPGARMFGEELNSSAEQLEKAYKKLESAAAGKDEKGRDIGPAEQKALVDAASSEIDALNARRREIAAQSDAFRYERTVEPQRQIDARTGRARSNLGAAGLEDGRIARRMREIENERETIRQRSALPEFQTPEMVRGLQDAEQALNEEAAAIEAATIAIKIFADALNRASEEAKGNLNSAQQRADEARRADLGNSTPQTQEARKQAEADLERQRETERAAQTEIAVERDRLEQMQQPAAERMQKIDEELKSGREFDPGLSSKREELQADAERAGNSADTSRQKLTEIQAVEEEFKTAQAEVNRSEQEFEKAIREKRKVREGLGIPSGLPLEEEDKQLRQAGRGDVADASMRAAGVFVEAESKRDELADRLKGGAVEKAREELAAAIERQAQAAKALAEIDEQIAAAPSGDRETLIREREALQAKMEDDAKASQAKVDSARDASTREAEQAKSGERGRELTRTPEQKFKAESEQGLADIQTYFERRAEDNNGLRPAGDAEAQAAAEDRFRKDREKEARTATSEGRGAELGMKERDRFRRDFKEGAGKDINARAKELKDNGEDPTKFLRQSLANQMEQVAPMMKQFQDERQNALLQGPSRAALNVSDVSTSQGASELTRLLRGDDSAKDVNLAELRKQSGYLEDIRNDLKANNPGVLL